MKLQELHGKKVAVLGLGVEGMATVEYFLAHTIPFAVFDEKSEKELRKTEGWMEFENKLAAHHVPCFFGQQWSMDKLSKYHVIVRSPGVSLHKASLLHLASTVMTSHTKLFFDNCPSKIIGVTGTKGKGTTSSLIYEMLKKSGFDAYLGGNIGLAPLLFLDTLSTQSVVVLELSSFQLEDMQKSPHIAVMLMVTQEHLDSFGNQNYHESIKEYHKAKRNILAFQHADDMAILNTDYPATKDSALRTQAKVAWVSRFQSVENGCFVRDGKVILRIGLGGPDAPYPAPMASFTSVQSSHSSGVPSRLTPSVIANNQKQSHFEYEVIDVGDILLPGGHNLENVCAASLAAYFAGVSIGNIAFVLRTFKGLEHRLELVQTIDGVRYYDDSFSTVPETAIAAIQAFTNPEVLILGGSKKGSNFTELGKVISKAPNIRAIIGIGIEWPAIQSRINPSTSSGQKLKIVEGLQDMESIVRTCQKLAKPGDVVLLSPACASFDMFKNYKDRGEQFKKQVGLL